jgi:phosphate-selective porin OprO/OprP
MSFVLLFQNFYAQDQGQSQDKKPQKVTPTIQLGGRIQYDFEFLKQEVDMGENYELNGQEFRRVYLEAGGTIYKNIKYKAQVELAGGEIAYRDMYIEFVKLPGIGGNLAFGSKAEATGLDMMTSSKYSTFFERAMLTNTQAFRWNSGIHYNNFDILNGQMGLQMSYTFNGDHKEGFIEGNLEEGGHFVARLTSPIYNDKEQKQLVHVGVNFENRKYSKNAADKSLKFRPENHMGEKVTVDFENLKNQNDLGFELAANFGAISFQGEYEMANYKREAETNKVSGYYTALSYFITGERRGFKKGAGSRVKPYKNFCIKDGDLGAIEVVARYSAMDFSDFRTADNELKKVANLSAGFNWYLNSHARLMYNYVTTSFDQQDINNLNGHLIRLQVDF